MSALIPYLIDLLIGRLGGGGGGGGGGSGRTPKPPPDPEDRYQKDAARQLMKMADDDPSRGMSRGAAADPDDDLPNNKYFNRIRNL